MIEGLVHYQVLARWARGGMADVFVALPYDNPPGGIKTCLNTKLARARVTLARRDLPTVVLATKHRAAFEILG